MVPLHLIGRGVRTLVGSKGIKFNQLSQASQQVLCHIIHQTSNKLIVIGYPAG